MSDSKPTDSTKALHGMAWRFLSTFTQLFLQTGVMILLARILPVSAFGLIAEVMLIVGFAGVISELGISQAVVHRHDLSSEHVRVGFTISVVSGLVLTMALILTASATSRFISRDDPAQLVPLLWLVSWMFLLTSFGTTAGALLERKLEFRTISLIDLGSYAIGYGIVGVAMALSGFGVWALAFPPVVTAGVKSTLLLCISRHSLLPSFDFEKGRQLLKFGAGIGLTRIANYGAHNADYLVVSRWLGTEPLGLYSRAYLLMTLPVYHLANTISTVLFPVYARMQNDPDRLSRVFLSSVTMTALAVFPVLTVVGITAPELIGVLFGPKWGGSIVPLQILCVAGCLRAITNLGDTVIRSHGLIYRQAIRHAIYAVNVLVGAGLGSFWEISGVSIGVSIAVLIHYGLISNLAIRLNESRWDSYLGCQLPGVVVALLLALVTLPLTLLMRSANLSQVYVFGGTLLIAGVTLLALVTILPNAWIGEISRDTIRQLQRKLGGRLRLFRLES